MRARIVRISVSFAAVFSAYLVYALLAVRLIEPSIAVVPKTTRSREKDDAARNVGNTAATQLRKYFPEGSWELENPKVVGNDRVKLLVSEYTNRPGGIMELKNCTMLFFEEQTPNGPSDMPPIIMQAPGGADLKFDEDFDLKRAKVGQPVGGRLKGKVTISRQPSRPGAHDDLKIVTRDVQLIEDRVVTPHVVEFWYGASHGTGRDLTILLNRKDTTGKPGKTPSIEGIKWLTLTRDVTVQMAVASPDGGAPAPSPGAAGANPFAPSGQGGAQPPVKITCQGPLRFDMEHQVCTFSERVDVFRLNPSGPSDEMNCELLAVHFAEREKPGETPAARNARQAAKGPQSLEARWIEALGDPVIIRAPSQGSQIRSQRVEYDLKSGRIVLDGPGKLQGASQGSTAGRYTMRWAHQMRVEPLVGEQKVTLLGGAEVTMTGMGSHSADGAPQNGTLWADEIRAWLTSPPGSGPAAAGPRKAGAPPMVVRPAPPPATDGSLALERARLKRVLAQGAVRIESPQLVGATGQLDAIFVPAPPAAPGAPGQPGQQNQSGPNGQGRRSSPSQQQFSVGGSKMEIHFTVRGAQTTVSELVLVGKAQLAEARTASPEDKPWLVTGERLEVIHADAPDTRIVVMGNPRAPDGRDVAASTQSSPPDRFGHVEARGLTLDGLEIQLQRDSNLLWIDGPGRLIGPAPADQDLFGQTLPATPKARPAEAGKVEITWKGRMQFDGLTAHFERDVVARSATMLIHSDTLDASLLRAVDFSKPPTPTPGAQGEQATLEQLVCRGGPRGMVELENRSTDETGLVSIDRMETFDLAINRTTGGIDARGPGIVTSVRRGDPAAMSRQQSGGAAAKPPAGAQPPPAADSQADPNALTFLAVKFARTISGNMHQREMTFANQVKTIYGPVAAWEATLDVENPDRAGPDSMALTCDALTVREEPGRQAVGRSWMELEAQGNVQAEGMGFVARSHRLTFSQQKSLMVMEGDGTSDALVFRQERAGGPRSNYNASRIQFWPSTRRIEVGNAHFIDLGATQANPARRDKNSATK